MKSGFLSECLVVCGVYLLISSYEAVGAILFGLGIIGGFIRYVIEVFHAQNLESRKLVVINAAESILLAIIKKFSESNATAKNGQGSTIH